MLSSKSVVVLRLFSFLLFAAPTAASGTSNAKHTESSTRTISSDVAAVRWMPPVGGYVASGISIVSRGSAIASSHAVSTDRSASTSSVQNGTQLTDKCWTQWSHYWDLSSKVKTMYTTFTTERVYNSVTGWSIPAWYSTSEGRGNFPTKTYVTTFITSEKIAQTFATTEANTTDVVTDQISTTITRPTCPLQSYVPQCQESWISWGSNGAVSYGQPACTQASISGAMCSSVLSQWLNYQRAELGEISGKIGMQWLPETNNGTTVWPSSTTNYYWPTSSAVAPGCTVGCQSCRVSGSSVKLLYWPPATSGLPNVTHFAGTGGSKHTVTAVTDGTTLTSPTVYISFDRLHASNSCSVIGKTLSNIIVAVTNSATLSSLYGWDRYWGLQQTASFNFTDLYATPVPHSIYMSQPRCASSSISLVYSCAPLGAKAPAACDTSNTPLLCATTLPYEPVIAIPKEVQQLQPEWDSCIGGIIGVYDPPQALHEAASAAGVTLPSEPKTTEHSDSSPDATTPAIPSPTISKAPPPTPKPTTSQPPSPTSTETSHDDQTELWSTKDVDIPASSTVAFSQAPSAEGSQAGSSDVASTDPQTAFDPTSTNALDVLTDAEAQFSNEPHNPNTAIGSSDAASMAYTTASVPTAIEATNGASDPTLFTYDPSTVEEQNTDASSSALHNGPLSTTGNSPLFTFDPPNPSEQTTSAVQPEPTLAIITANDQTLSAVESGSHVFIIDASKTATLTAGQETIIESSQTLKLQDSQGLVVGDSTISLDPASSSLASTTAAAAAWTASDHQTFSAIIQGSNLIVAGAATTATLNTAATILAGQTVSVLPSNAGIVVDGSSLPISSPHTAAAHAAIFTAPNGAIVSALPGADDGIVLAGPSSTFTLTPGGSTTYQGQTLSVASRGGAVVLDGSRTMAVSHVFDETSLPVIAIGTSSTTIQSAKPTPSSQEAETSTSPPSTASTASSTGSSTRKMPGNLAWLFLLPLLYIA